MEVVLLIVILVVLLALGARGRTTTRRIEELAPGTMLVHHADGSKREHEYSSGTDDYYHEECAADHLSCDGTTVVEIKDVNGKIYRYDRAAMVRLKWF